ncbi:MAG: Rieske 2Fe-2S domain-containing protein, partial [Candidatus Tectomicrobia bacterium]|nr:Rieske 2Fe-2S domain-containing protein [Candidatus Tectomicrobia bacterium]
MLIVRFDMQEINFLIVGDATYFLLVTASGQRALVNGKCPHRGGPLHLACLDKAGLKLICPWHEARVALKWLLAAAMPMVCVDDQATALLPVPPETEVHLARRRIKLVPVPIGANAPSAAAPACAV